MWKYSDFVRTPNQKTASKVDLEMITWSANKVGARDLIGAQCFPVVACLARPLDDDVTMLEAGTVIQLYGSIKSDLEILHVVRVEEIHNFISSRSGAPSRFKSREISTIDEEEEENSTFGHDLDLKVAPGNGGGDDDDVLICSHIDEGWLRPGEVLMVPCKLKPKFRLPLKPPTMSEDGWEELLESLTRSTNLIDLDAYIKKLASTPSNGNHIGMQQSSSIHHFNDDSRGSTNLPVEPQIENGETVKTLLPKSSESQNKFSLKRGVRKIKSMLNVYEELEAESDHLQPEINNSCSDLHRSILSIFSASNLSLSSNIQGSEFLNILRPMNYKRQMSEPVKTKSRFSIFRAKKSKKSKRMEQTEEEARNIQSEMEKTKRFVDLLDIVGKPKSSDRSVMGSILNLSDLNSSLYDLPSSKHLSMPCDIDKIKSMVNNSQLSSRPLPLERYFINRQDHHHQHQHQQHHQMPSDANIMRKKQIKTNLRIQNKFGSQVIPSRNKNAEEFRRSLYPEDFSRSVENVICLKEFNNAEHKERSCQRLGISMLGAKADNLKNNSNMLAQDVNKVENVSQLSIIDPPSHFHSIIRTNPHMNRRKVKQQQQQQGQQQQQQQQKFNLKQFSKSTLSTEEDFQFVRLLSIRKTSETTCNNINNNRSIHSNNINNSNNNINNRNNEAIYENINFTSDTSPQDSLIPAESLNSRTNSTESSDCMNSDTSFGGPNDPLSPQTKFGAKYPQRKSSHRIYDDDGYQSSFDNFNADNFTNNYPFVSEVVSYL